MAVHPGRRARRDRRARRAPAEGAVAFRRELDSLADSISFGVAPAVIVYLWELQECRGWAGVALCLRDLLACCGLRASTPGSTARSAAQVGGLPDRRAGAGRRRPAAPAGAALAGQRPADGGLVARLSPGGALVGLSAFLMISNVATWSLGSLRLRRSLRLEAIALVALVGGALFTAPWETLSVIVLIYLALIPFSMMSYARIKRQRRHAARRLRPGRLRPRRPPRRRRNAAQGGDDRRPMRLQREFQDRRERGDEAEEEDDRERMSHSFSPDLSTAKSPKGWISSLDGDNVPFLFCVKRQTDSDLRQAVRYLAVFPAAGRQ